MAYVQLNTNEMRDYITSSKITGYDMSAMVGRSPAFISGCIKNGRMLDVTYKMLMERLGLPYETFIKPEYPNVEHTPSTQEGPYSLHLEVHPDKVFLALHFNGQEMYHAYSKVKGDKELDLVQAISYAAHMIYKMSEQEYLRGKK